jgi:pimeloyl-ACP methyl ester carboxylesterase
MIYVAAILLGLLTLYWLILVGMFLFQRKLLYHPSYGAQNPFLLKLEGAKKYFVTSHGNTILTLLHHPAKKDYPTIIYFHGNTGSLATEFRIERLNHFAKAGFGYAAVSFRGFGDSGGTISEQGLYHDARASIELVRRKLKTPLQNMILFGESLGSGVAVRMATEHCIKGIALDSPYCSITDRAKEKYPWLPVSAILKDTFNSHGIIHRVICPILIIHGDQDETMPIHHGKRLFDTAREPKRGLFIEGLGHVDYPADKLCEAIKDYFCGETTTDGTVAD